MTACREPVRMDHNKL